MTEGAESILVVISNRMQICFPPSAAPCQLGDNLRFFGTFVIDLSTLSKLDLLKSNGVALLQESFLLIDKNDRKLKCRYK